MERLPATIYLNLVATIISFSIAIPLSHCQPYTFLFVGEGTPALHKGAFKLMETTPGGREVLKPITMPKAGLFYHLIEWIRVSGPTLSPT